MILENDCMKDNILRSKHRVSEYFKELLLNHTLVRNTFNITYTTNELPSESFLLCSNYYIEPMFLST